MARPPKPDRMNIRLTARFADVEANAVKARADAAGLSVSDLVRAAVLRQPPARTRRPHVRDSEQLGKVLAAVGRIGGNLNQLAKTANSGGWPEAAALNEAVADIHWMRNTLMLALGITPAPPSPSQHFRAG